MSSSSAKRTEHASCIVCREPVAEIQDFGLQPITNRFPAAPNEVVPSHAMVVGQCGCCGLVQLTTPPSPEVVRPPEAISYREPEEHLDDLVYQMLSLPGVSSSSHTCGLTYKDSSTLERLEKLGCANVRVLDAAADLGIADPASGLETIQQKLTVGLANQLVDRFGAFDVLIARHIVEHAHSLASFLEAAGKLLAAGGYLVVEVPDSADSLRTCDYTMMWEEHVAYFTSTSLSHALSRCGFRVAKSIVYPYAQESSLIAIAQVSDANPVDTKEASSADNIARNYGAQFEGIRERWRQKLLDLQRTTGPVAIFGAGHRTIAFIHLLRLDKMIDFVIDDAEHKIGRYLPGSKLQISPPSVFESHPPGVCLLTIPLKYEDDVIARYPQVRENGGEFFSIFAESPYMMCSGDDDRSSPKGR